MIDKIALAHMNHLMKEAQWYKPWGEFGKQVGSELSSGAGRKWSGLKGGFKKGLMQHSEDKKYGATKTLGSLASVGIPLGIMAALAGRGLFKGIGARFAAKAAGKPMAASLGSKLALGLGGFGALKYGGPKLARKFGMGAANPWDMKAYQAGLLR